MFVKARRVLMSMVAAALALPLLTGCGSFPLKYQNYFTKNFAYFASNYDGDPNSQLSSGAESNNFEDGNESSYSAGKVPHVIAGFRTLEYHNTNYAKGSQFDIEFVATVIPPGKSEGVQVASFDLQGKGFSSKAQIPEVAKIVLIKMSYPAPMIYLDNKALQAKYGSGEYTFVWKAVREDGQAVERELSRVSTNLVP